MENCKFATTRAIAQKYGKHIRTVRRWIEEGRVTAKRDPGGRCWLIIELDDKLTEHKGT